MGRRTLDSRAKKNTRPRVPWTGVAVCCLLLWVGSLKKSGPTSCWAAACLPQESHLTVAAYSSPHIQSELVTDHLHFGRPKSTRQCGRGLAKPSRAAFGRDCRSRLRGDSHRHWDTGLSRTPYCPPPGSSSGKRLSRNHRNNRHRLFGSYHTSEIGRGSKGT